MFSIVPVLDLKSGQVVHARAGDRARYEPIRTPLAVGSAPATVLDGLLALAPFRQVYIADLDAIERRGDHRAVIAKLIRHHPGIDFWVDAGLAEAEAAADLAAIGATPVLGSESLASAEVLRDTLAQTGMRRCVLSLDHRGHAFLGPAEIETEPERWPDRVIAMTLSRVGSGSGPDLARLAMIHRRAGARQVFAAGGVRHRDDLDRLAAMGIAGALVATALHDGRLDRAALAAFFTEER